MAHGNRPGRPHGDRERSLPQSAHERTLVLPGEELPTHGLRPGTGTYRTSGKIYASVLGFVQERPPFVQVTPLSGRYIPKPDDTIIGYVADVQGTFWLLDIGAPRWAPLHMTGTPWKIEIGETDQYLKVGDAVLVRVENLDATGRIGVTMIGEGLGRLDGGAIVTISPAKIPRVIGRKGSMIESIIRITGARVAVGQNGRIWIDGTPEAIVQVRQALEMIEDTGHRSGLTERVQELLRSSPRPTREEPIRRPPNPAAPNLDREDPVPPGDATEADLPNDED
ncbi:MAG: exosome complex RNA-binding protein Rrp4 [Candidatus Thermoplasmatota archaeon]|nr:exosome complex RNA-binding protein Rrp4 [Candidatus Thermoplasmatota archaeon]